MSFRLVPKSVTLNDLVFLQLLELLLFLNGREQLDYGVNVPLNYQSGTNQFSIQLELNRGDRINCRSITTNHKILVLQVQL